MKYILYLIKSIFIIFLLTVLTQIGGLIYLISKLVFKRSKHLFPTKTPLLLQKTVTFLLLYLTATFLFIPPLAKMNGRVPLPYFSKNATLQPANFLTVVLNRHYVHPILKELTEKISTKINNKHPGTQLSYLDANFPFWNGFPLLPHISHNDGKKIDLNFLYKHQKTGNFIDERLTFTGYGFCEKPREGELNQPAICQKRGYWQYNLLEKFVNKSRYPYVQFDEARNRALLQIIALEKKTGKILIEPHLKKRLRLTSYKKVRYHGCHAVRHDDHIHLQL
jgi:hypothetical protein